MFIHNPVTCDGPERLGCRLVPITAGKEQMCHVLIIEDDFFISDYIMFLAQKGGATSFDQACTEEEAVRMALDHKPAVILSDVRLIEGTGPAAVKAIEQAYGTLPVIFVTATPGACQPCDPPAVVLSKPVQDRLLVETFRSVASLAGS